MKKNLISHTVESAIEVIENMKRGDILNFDDLLYKMFPRERMEMFDFVEFNEDEYYFFYGENEKGEKTRFVGCSISEIDGREIFEPFMLEPFPADQDFSCWISDIEDTNILSMVHVPNQNLTFLFVFDIVYL